MEFPTLDKQCSHPECNQLDFLPLQCCHCQNVFCKDHLGHAEHSCSKSPDVRLTDEEVAKKGKKTRTCSLEGCSDKILAAPCKICHGFYCKKHQKDLHGCLEQHPTSSGALLATPTEESESSPKCSVEHCPLVVINAAVMEPCRLCGKAYCRVHEELCHGCVVKKRARREKFEAPKKQFQAAKLAVDKMLDANIEKARGLSGAKLATANKIQLMRLKQRAVGYKKIADSERVYFLVHWKGNGDSSELEKKPVFVSRSWSIGRAVDSMAEFCGVVNKNNLAASPQLKLFNMDGENVYGEMSTLLENLLKDNVLLDGGSLLLDYESNLNA